MRSVMSLLDLNDRAFDLAPLSSQFRTRSCKQSSWLASMERTFDMRALMLICACGHSFPQPYFPAFQIKEKAGNQFKARPERYAQLSDVVLHGMKAGY